MVFETKDQIIRRKKLARFKFRFLARKALFNKAWLSELDEQIGENVKKNIAIILKRPHRKGALTIIEKRLLKKHWKSRSEEEEEKLKKLFDTLPCFRTFTPVCICNILNRHWNYHNLFLSQLIRNKLIKVVEFCYFPRDKVLYLENHISLSMFFILSGEVTISKLAYNKNDDNFTDEAVNILSNNSFFGHIGLIYNTTRNATCKTQSECFLCLCRLAPYRDLWLGWFK